MIGLGDRLSDPVGSGWVLTLALIFYVAGCFLLVFTGASFGAVHAFAAFIVLAIVAALNQLLPVLTHAPVARPQLVLAIALAFAAGFLLLIAGFYGTPTFPAAAIVLSLSALVWVAWNAARLIAGTQELQTRTLMACALLGFAIAAGLGAAMAVTLTGSWSAPIAALAPLHASLAIIGFASLLILAISYRFVPMFAIAHGTAYGRRLVQWLAVASVVVVAAFLYSTPVLRIGLLGLLISAVIIGISHLRTVSSRLRKRLDVSLRYGSVAWSLGIIALLLALASTWQSRFGIAAMILGVLGWISITILGYAYKVAGFLAWQTAKDRNRLARLPALSTAVNLPLAYFALTLLSLGAAIAAACSFLYPEHMQVGFDIYAAGGLSAVATLMKLASIYVFRKQINEYSARAVG